MGDLQKSEIVEIVGFTRRLPEIFKNVGVMFVDLWKGSGNFGRFHWTEEKKIANIKATYKVKSAFVGHLFFKTKSQDFSRDDGKPVFLLPLCCTRNTLERTLCKNE